jgi:hypothetical protein
MEVVLSCNRFSFSVSLNFDASSTLWCLPNTSFLVSEGLLLFVENAKHEDTEITAEEHTQALIHIAHLAKLNEEVRNANVLGCPVSFHAPEHRPVNDKNEIQTGVVT